MDLQRVLDELKRERAAIEEAIVTLERLVHRSGKRRGRPPRWMVELSNKPEEKAQAKRARRPAQKEATA